MKWRLFIPDEGTWLLEGTQFKELSTVPRNHSVPIRLVNLDPLPVTVHRNIKIATAKLITDEAICTACENAQPTTELDLLLHPLPYEITESQNE